MARVPTKEQDSNNAWRLYYIHRILRRLAMDRESPVCETVDDVRLIRSKAIDAIRTVCRDDWEPEDPDSDIQDMIQAVTSEYWQIVR